MKTYDVIIIGAGAAGLSAAKTALGKSKKVAIIDLGEKPARKVAVSGGGRCNFTNDAIAPNRYFGANADFVRSAISKVASQDILNWVKSHNLKLIEKTTGQYFCATGAQDIVNTLLQDIKGADLFLNTLAADISKSDDETFIVKTNKNTFISKSIIIATGGISYPVLGVSDFGYKIAKKFGHKIVPVRPALCAIATKMFPPELSGISFEAEASIGKEKIKDSILITHFGLGGPAIYRATVRNIVDDIHINMLPDINIFNWLKAAKTIEGKKNLATVLSSKLPLRLARYVAQDTSKNIADFKDSELKIIAEKISNWVIPKGSFNLYNLQSAEVVRGGVSTTEISSKTMESKLCPGLFFAGEVLDIAGDLGGFNLHWAFASGRIAGENA